MHVILRHPVTYRNSYAELPAVDPTLGAITFSVEEVRWIDEGGYLSAVIDAYGTMQDLRMLSEKLMYVCDVYDENADLVWTGAIHSTEFSDGASIATLSMDECRNSLRLIYMRVNSAAETQGTRTVSGWVSDTPSVVRYGVHMLTMSGGKMTSTEAAGFLATELKRKAWPRKVVSARQDTVRCRLYCRGFLFYLTRTYTEMLEGLEKNDVSTDAGQNFGEGSKINYAAQKAALLAAVPPHWAGTEPFIAKTVVVLMRKTVETINPVTGAGTYGPTDTVVLEVCEDSWGQACQSAVSPGLGSVAPNNYAIKMTAKLPQYATFRLRDTQTPFGIDVWATTQDPVADGGQWRYENCYRSNPSLSFATDHMIVEVPAPGNVVAGGTSTAVDASAIPTYLSEVSFTGLSFSMTTTPVWLRLKRTGAPNAGGDWLGKGYYTVAGIKSKPYIRGNALIHYDASTGREWRMCYPDDMQLWFKIAGERDTYAQALKLAIASGWIKSGCVVTDYSGTPPSSGLTTIPYRNGETNLADEIVKLCRRGTSDYRRIVFTLGPTRHITIRPAPVETGPKYVLEDDGSLTDPQGQPVRKTRGIVGVWYVSRKDVETTRNAAGSAQAMYLKEYGYRPREDTVDLRSDNTLPAYHFASEIETG